MSVSLVKIRYYAGWNMPGYLPETWPASFATFNEAAEFLMGALEEVAEDPDAYSDAYNAMRGLDMDVGLRWEGDYASNDVGGYVYWITKIEK